MGILNILIEGRKLRSLDWDKMKWDKIKQDKMKWDKSRSAKIGNVLSTTFEFEREGAQDDMQTWMLSRVYEMRGGRDRWESKMWVSVAPWRWRPEWSEAQTAVGWPDRLCMQTNRTSRSNHLTGQLLQSLSRIPISVGWQWRIWMTISEIFTVL